MAEAKFKTFTEAFNAEPARVPANDNVPKQKREPQPRYRGTLPALNWLFKRDPILAEALAYAVDAVRAKPATAALSDGLKLDIRPTVGELLKASEGASPTFTNDGRGRQWLQLGDLRFLNGALQFWGKTKKGRKLAPSEASRGREKASSRNPSRYLQTKPTTPSPMHAESLQREFSGQPAIASMLSELPGVAEARRELEAAYARSPSVKIKVYPTVVAQGASFLGGVTNLKGNSSSGHVGPWDAPDRPKGTTLVVVEEVAAGGNLQSIGELFGHTGDYAARVGKRLLMEAALTLAAANDNNRAAGKT